MGKSSRYFSLTLIMIMAISSLSLLSALHFGLAQSGTNVSYIITQDSTWTPAGSPYTLTGDTLVNQGVTLTIEPGVTVNLGSHYIEVNGTLSAIGSPSDKINFNGGQITFTTSSNGWSEQTNSGCLIENSIIDQTSISSSNPIKIDNSIISSQFTVTSSIISNNVVTGEINCQSSIPALGQSNAPVDTSVISGNTINGNIVLGAVSLGAITAPSEASTVSNNTVYGSIISGSPQGTPQIFNNTVTSAPQAVNSTVSNEAGIVVDGYASVYNNYIYGCTDGISLFTERVFGGNLPCSATVENNIVTDCSQGISISLTAVGAGGETHTPTIINNTISGNIIGISLSGFGYDATPTIKYNNLQSNSNYTFYLQESNNADLSYNWWGTTDAQAINQTIYDFKDDFTLGVVTFVPFLTAPNPEVITNSNAPILTPKTSLSPTAVPNSAPTSTAVSHSTLSPTPTSTSVSSPTNTTLLLTTTVALVVIALLLAIIISLLIHMRKQKPINLSQ
jgi:hypothetical protein